MITCDDCGKVNGEGDVGEHWICESCRVPDDKAPALSTDQADSTQPITH